MNPEREYIGAGLQETCEQAAKFLESVFQKAGLELQVTERHSAAGCSLNIDGSDTGLLLNEAGELLDALQHLLNQAFGRTLPQGNRIVCDVHSYRATREAELKAMAHHAAERVRATGVPFMFGPMSANERRIIHVTLAESGDLHTESVGEGPTRKLKVTLQSVDH